MLSKLLALVISFALAVPANAAKVSVGNTGSAGAGAAGSIGSVGTTLSGPGAALALPQIGTGGLNSWIGDTLSPTGALQTIPTSVLAEGLRQSLPQVAAAVDRASLSQNAVTASAEAESLTRNLASNPQDGRPVAVADAVLLAALTDPNPSGALRALSDRFRKDAQYSDVADRIDEIRQKGNPAIRRISDKLKSFKAELGQALEAGNVDQYLGQVLDQSRANTGPKFTEAPGVVVAAGERWVPRSAADGGLQAVASVDAQSARRSAGEAATRSLLEDARSQTSGRTPAQISALSPEALVAGVQTGRSLPALLQQNLTTLESLAPALEIDQIEGKGSQSNAPKAAGKTPAKAPARSAGRQTAGRVDAAAALGEPVVQAELQPDFIDIGMGPTGMMAMIAAVASGRTAVGVEIRAEPVRGVHQNVREEWFHVLGLLDKMMLERYGEAGIPKLWNGKPFLLADFFYNNERAGGGLDFGEIWGVGDEQNQNVAGRLQKITFEDAREETLAANGGKSKVYVLPPPKIPEKADPGKITGNMQKVLDSPSTFQVALINYELMLRKYLAQIEKLDRETGRPPRVKTYENHRVVQKKGEAAGYIDDGDDNMNVVIEEVVDQRDAAGKANRVRKPGTMPIDLGTPQRFALSVGFGGGVDGKTLGYTQENVTYRDSNTGQTIEARQNWIAVEVTGYTGGQLHRRISTYTDPQTGAKSTVRQIAVGHENTPNVSWVPVQVPDTLSFDPVKAGKVPAGTPETSKEYAAAAREMILDYTVSQISAVTHIPEADIRRMRMFYGPSPFTLQEKLGESAHLAANGNVAGDLMGNGHFLTSGGSMTGMIGHTLCFLRYWDNIARGVPPDVAAKILEDGIKAGSEAWLHVSQKEFDSLAPANFGQERANAIGIKNDAGSAGSNAQGRGFGLAQVLGQQSWADSFRRLFAGEFGKANVDFYVPPAEIDITQDPNITVHEVALPGGRP